MNTDFSKLKQRTAESEAVNQRAVEETASGNSRQFGAVEDLLRHDSAQNPVPPDIAEKLDRSIAVEPKPARSWFSRLLGGS